MASNAIHALFALAIALVVTGAPSAQRAVPLRPGMIVTQSIVVRPGTYRLAAAADMKVPALVVRGSNITVDFNGAVLAGSADGADPDTMAGVGLLIDGGSRVTVKNATIRGYKVAILARNSPDLHLTGNDLSYNWKQRLYSGIDKESLVDWMSFHHNEQDEWLRYGAAIYLRGCDRAEVDHNTAVQGQDGLMVTSSTGLRIWNNTFQYLSAIGVGLYRVTASDIMHNRIDWCVRGYSHGFYNRGQDSAGLLMYERSSHNTVAYNSITHGGDGLFLWAGQSTMDTGQGGSNDNLFYGNDFSYAPTNGIEATFSRNTFVANRVEECWHGVWGGYSFDSLWQGNHFARNVEGMAIEHGQNNTIDSNTFDRDETAIRLWQNASQDPGWGYAKARDTRSHGYRIERNTFTGNKVALDIKRSTDVTLAGNTFEKVGTSLSLAGEGRNITFDAPGERPAPSATRVPPLAGGMDPMIKDGERRGRDAIIVDEWGPYDWKSPKVWPVLEPGATGTPGLKGPANGGPVYRLRVIGPAGEWKVASAKGATVSPQSGSVPQEITVTTVPGPAIDIDVAFEYRGAAVVSPRGAKTLAGAPYLFHYAKYFVPIDWQIKFFEYTGATDPVKQPGEFAKLIASGTPLKTLARDRLDYMSGGAFEEGLPRDNFAFAAEGTADLPPGDYSLTVISDDGVRVWVDGELVLDDWEPHESKVDTVKLAGGRHRLAVQYYEVGGFAEMHLDIQRK